MGKTKQKKKVFCSLLLLLVVWITAWAQNESIFLKTKYERGLFETVAILDTGDSSEIMSGIILDADAHFRRLNIDSLFWLFKGLSGKEEGRNLIGIDCVDVEYDQNKEIFDFFINIHVGIMKKQFRNVRITVLMKTTERDSNGYPVVTVELGNPNFFLKSAKLTLNFHQVMNKRQLVIQSSVRFGRFFNLFISTSNYCAIAEWRIETVLKNLKAETERRQNISDRR